MKVGDLVRIDPVIVGGSRTGIIVRLKSFASGGNPQPIVLIDGKIRLYGELACEVVSEGR